MPKALSLKYRPRTFNDLIGQESVSQTLSLALELDKVSHAYLFSGLRGSGKTSSARIFSRALQCEKYPTSTPCGECSSCISAMNGSHLDIVEMDAASSRGIDDIKSLIEQMAYPPSYGRFKIFIIDEIHMLTKEAFNAFLKTLEEPPEYVKFILATTDPLKLPATILSRTQHFRFKQIPQASIATHLKRILSLEEVKFEDEAINLLSRNCSGSLRDAITMLEQAIIFSKEHITLSSVSNMLGALNPSKLEEFFRAVLQKDEESINKLLLEFEAYEAEGVIDEMISFLKGKFLQKDSMFNLIILERFFKILGEAKNMLGMNADSSFVLLLTSLKLKESLNIQEIDKIIRKIENEMLDFAKEAPNLPPNAESSVESKPINATLNTPSNIASNAPSQIPSNPPSALEQVIDKELDDINSGKAKFEQLIKKIYDRDYDLGEMFSKNIIFISLEDSTLSWESHADESTKEKIKPYFKIIQEFIKEIFGNVKIKNIDNKKPIKIVESTQDSSNNSLDSTIKNIKNIFTITKEEKLPLQ